MPSEYGETRPRNEVGSRCLVSDIKKRLLSRFLFEQAKR